MDNIRNLALYMLMQSLTSTTQNSQNLCAVIYMGASSLSLLIADKSCEYSMVDFLMQPLPLARDIFRDGNISRATIERSVHILDTYKEVLKEYGGEQCIPVRLIAANILSEANNKDAFLHRIQIANEFTLEPLDDGEMTRLIYLKTQESLQDIPSIKEKTVLITHVGPGNTRILVAHKNSISNYYNYRLGTHRTGEALELDSVDSLSSLEVIREHIRGQLDQLKVDNRHNEINEMVAIGHELQSLAPHFRKKNESRILVSTLKKFAIQLANQSLEERVITYNTDYAVANALLPAFAINIAIAESMNLTHVYIPYSVYDSTLMRDLLVLSYSRHQDLANEVIGFAETLADRYQADKKHRRHVLKLANSLFDQLQSLHQLNEHDKLLIQVSAILHEIGSYISARQHNHHARYIVTNTDIFGLNDQDVTVIALLLYYHRREHPTLDDEDYRKLSLIEQVRVSKMTSLLRIAVGLDRTHSQRISAINTEIHHNQLNIKASGVIDTTVEQIALIDKASLFEEVFGLNVHISPNI